MITLKHANCMDVEIPKCRLLLTDIPYEMGNKKDSGLRKLSKGVADIATFELLPFLNHVYDSFDICVIFCGQVQVSTIFEFFDKKQNEGAGTARQLVWAKTNPSPMNGEYLYLSGVENAIWFKKRGTGKLNCHCKTNVFSFPSGSSDLHPTEKNHKLLEDLILDNTDKKDLIVDTCFGSCSTGVIAFKNDRRFFGIELFEKYYDIGVKRMADVKKNGYQLSLEDLF